MLRCIYRKGMNMTKKEAKQMFAESIFTTISKNDIPAIRQAWNDYVDTLQKSSQITQVQANKWVNPFLSKKNR